MGFALLAVAGAAAQDLTPGQMLAHVEESLYPDSFFMRGTLETHRPDRRDSTMTMESYHKEGVGTFIEIVAPARSRGIRFLQKSGSLWLYNPKSGSRRAIRLSPRESFQGSVFSNNDVGDPTYVDDYTPSYTEPETIEHPTLDSVPCYVLVGEAKHPEAAYGRVKIWVRQSDLQPVLMEMYAKSGLLFKRMILRDFKQMAGRLRASVMHMESQIQEDTYSLVTIEVLERRAELSDRLFTQAYLTR
jgi:outer membrane lipoprotein-sorting protein